MIKEPTEFWVRHPVLDFIEGSSFGNVRTIERVIIDKNGRKRIIPGKVLTPADNGKGYLAVHFGKNGRQAIAYLHRLIAECFIPNPNGLSEVNHKDKNPKNNCVDNLEWCSPQYNIEYREKYGTSAAEAVGRPLYAYNLKTLEELHFKSQCEAGHKLGLSQGSINNVIKGRRKIANGYYFTEDKSKITRGKLQAIKDNMNFLGGVIAVNLKTLEILHFKSKKEASQELDIDSSNINAVIKGRYKQTHSYWFANEDENTVEKTRIKFGDSVANKVEELMEYFL